MPIFFVRYYRIVASTFHSFGLRHDDIIYNCLPLYHSAGRLGLVFVSYYYFFLSVDIVLSIHVLGFFLK